MPTPKDLKALAAGARRAVARERQRSRAELRREEEESRKVVAAEAAARANVPALANEVWAWVTGPVGSELRRAAAGLFAPDLLPVVWRDGTPAPAFHTGCWTVHFPLEAPGIVWRRRVHPAGGTGGIAKSSAELAQTLPPLVLAALAQALADGTCWDSIRDSFAAAGAVARARFADAAEFAKVLALERA